MKVHVINRATVKNTDCGAVHTLHIKIKIYWKSRSLTGPDFWLGALRASWICPSRPSAAFGQFRLFWPIFYHFWQIFDYSLPFLDALASLRPRIATDNLRIQTQDSEVIMSLIFFDRLKWISVNAAWSVSSVPVFSFQV